MKKDDTVKILPSAEGMDGVSILDIGQIGKIVEVYNDHAFKVALNNGEHWFVNACNLKLVKSKVENV